MRRAIIGVALGLDNIGDEPRGAAALTLAPAALAAHFDNEPFSYGPEPFGIVCGQRRQCV
jgi:hypothetical protein